MDTWQWQNPGVVVAVVVFWCLFSTIYWWADWSLSDQHKPPWFQEKAFDTQYDNQQVHASDECNIPSLRTFSNWPWTSKADPKMVWNLDVSHGWCFPTTLGVKQQNKGNSFLLRQSRDKSSIFPSIFCQKKQLFTKKCIDFFWSSFMFFQNTCFSSFWRCAEMVVWGITRIPDSHRGRGVAGNCWWLLKRSLSTKGVASRKHIISYIGLLQR